MDLSLSLSLSLFHIQRLQKRYACFAKQEPGWARQKIKYLGHTVPVLQLLLPLLRQLPGLARPCPLSAGGRRGGTGCLSACGRGTACLRHAIVPAVVVVSPVPRIQVARSLALPLLTLIVGIISPT